MSNNSEKSEIKDLCAKINALCQQSKVNAENPITLMEVCGTHTMSIARFGLRQLLPEDVRLLSGPGCPVCVTPNSAIDTMIEIALQPGVTACTFGDMIRVPGSRCSLQDAKAEGADVRIVYSPMDALALAKNFAEEEEQNSEEQHVKACKPQHTIAGKTQPQQTVVFLGVGFETTTPISAAVIKRAEALGIKNFCIYSAHKNMPGALSLIASDPKLKVDGFILPGHVTTITGLQQFEFLAAEHNIPGVVAGFGAAEILKAIKMLCEQIANMRRGGANSSRAKIQNAYTSGVRNEGNTHAQALINEVFETTDTEWRGLGTIKDSGYKIRSKFANFDASRRYKKLIEQMQPSKEHKGCRCGDILKGTITPNQCPLFTKKCKPENPIGPCMVSSEGTCAAFYKYHL